MRNIPSLRRNLPRWADHVTRCDICGFGFRSPASERWKVFLSLLLMPRINSSTHCGPTNIVTCEVNADNAPLSCLCLRDAFDFCSATRRHVGVRRRRSSQCWREAQLRKTGPKKKTKQVTLCSCVQFRTLERNEWWLSLLSLNNRPVRTIRKVLFSNYDANRKNYSELRRGRPAFVFAPSPRSITGIGVRANTLPCPDVMDGYFPSEKNKKNKKNCRKKKITVAAGFVSKKAKLCCGRLKIQPAYPIH